MIVLLQVRGFGFEAVQFYLKELLQRKRKNTHFEVLHIILLQHKEEKSELCKTTLADKLVPKVSLHRANQVCLSW